STRPAGAKRGWSRAGMPSLPGPPLAISLKGTLWRLKSVFQPAVSALGGGADRGLAAGGEVPEEQPATSVARRRGMANALISQLDAPPRISGAAERIKEGDEPAEGQAGPAGGQRSSRGAFEKRGPPPLALDRCGPPRRRRARRRRLRRPRQRAGPLRARLGRGPP